MRPSMDPSYLYYKNTRECYLPVTSNKSTANKIERKEMKDLNEFLWENLMTVIYMQCCQYFCHLMYDIESVYYNMMIYLIKHVS